MPLEQIMTDRSSFFFIDLVCVFILNMNPSSESIILLMTGLQWADGEKTLVCHVSQKILTVFNDVCGTYTCMLKFPNYSLKVWVTKLNANSCMYN
jgi:hypothetical protein